MQPTRRARLESVIQEELSRAVREVKDPRVPIVTFTGVSLTPDGGHATIYVSILGRTGGEASDEADREMRECIKGLTSASGFLRRHLGRVLTVRTIPAITFKPDRGLDNTLRVHELLKQIGSEERPEGGAPESAAPIDAGESSSDDHSPGEDSPDSLDSDDTPDDAAGSR